MKRIISPVTLLVVVGGLIGATGCGNQPSASALPPGSDATNPVPTNDHGGGADAAFRDSDGDGFADDDEIHGTRGTDPFDATDNPNNVRDTDGDGCSDYDELNFAGLCDNDPTTHPDSDADGFPDDEEISGSPATDPLDPTDNPESVRDTDGDGCSDFEEINFGGYCDNDPETPVDGDEDGLLDIEEILIGTDPFSPDTDGDGLLDGYEVAIFFDPLTADWDGDGLDDSGEWLHGTDPYDHDTDDDWLTDWEELNTYGTEPLVWDTDGDELHDGLELAEFVGSDPLDADTDGDGIEDGVEYSLFLDILLPNPTGVVVEVYCSDYILAESGDLLGLFEVSAYGSVFPSGFFPGDLIAFSLNHGPYSPIGPIKANLRTLESGLFHWEGQPVPREESTTITDIQHSQYGSSIEIIIVPGPYGRRVYFSLRREDAEETHDWLVGDDVMVTMDRVEGINLYSMLNMDRCENISVSR